MTPSGLFLYCHRFIQDFDLKFPFARVSATLDFADQIGKQDLFFRLYGQNAPENRFHMNFQRLPSMSISLPVPIRWSF
ncbi:MAG: hypothetical protein JO007_12575 [Alphaproteobacteria bacterium]|nr:hypothetical protein [Alphaproteobacteria bacterium]